MSSQPAEEFETMSRQHQDEIRDRVRSIANLRAAVVTHRHVDRTHVVVRGER